MKILVVEKYKGFEDYIERYRIYFGKDEGESPKHGKALIK